MIHHDDLVGETLGLEQQVRAHEDGLAAFGHLVDEPEHGARRLGVEAGGRLVEQEEVGFVEHGAGEGEPGPHAGGVAADPLASASEMPNRSAASAIRASVRRGSTRNSWAA